MQINSFGDQILIYLSLKTDSEQHHDCHDAFEVRQHLAGFWPVEVTAWVAGEADDGTNGRMDG